MRNAIITLSIVILLAACAPSAPGPEPQDSGLIEGTAVVVPPDPEPEPEPEPVVELKTPNQEVIDLSARAGEIEAYSFTVARLPETSGDHIYYVVDDKARVELVTTINIDEGSADYVFIDYPAESAMGYCVDLGRCKTTQIKGAVSFKEYAITLPMDWLDQIQYAEITQALQFNNRPVTVVEWKEDGKYYQAYLDNFYGVPQRVAVATDEDFENIVGGFEYQRMAPIKEEEAAVEPPY